MLTILEGATFCMSDAIGDISGGTEGLFADDTRMLSRWKLRVDGASPLLLTSQVVEYFTAAHYARNAPTALLAPDTISVRRERFIGRGMTERIVLRNEGMDALAFPVELELGSDFADIISVKSFDIALGDPDHVATLPAERRPERATADSLRIVDAEGYTTTVRFSSEPILTPTGVRFELQLEPHGSWELTIQFTFSDATATTSRLPLPVFGTELEHVRATLNAWKLRVPRLTGAPVDLERAYERSIADLASLRLGGLEGISELPAAGMPWFMTVFGRDTLITSLQTLLFGPELASGALRALAALQASEDVASIDAEPGKIIHELRRGKAATTWFPVYYGSIDATPLFLVLLSELWRWTGDDSIVHELREPALAAIGWIENHGDTDGDGFLEYRRRTERGLENQSWKDSGDSQRFADGRFAEPPIAPVEVQGYAYDARRRTAELARRVWRDEALASRLDADADDLAQRFDRAFWLEERQGYALALDREKAPVDALCSNMGHLLWSGIVPEHRRAAVAATLTGEALWSGWGVRTMGATETAYNPLSYHNGTVWPHDTALTAWGLAGAGCWDEAELLASSLIEAARSFDYSLPEVFAGFARSETAFPVAYPTAARPQAWAAGAPVLCLTILLGLRPDRESGALVSTTPTPPPAWLVGTRLDGVRALGRSWRVEVGTEEIVISAVE